MKNDRDTDAVLAAFTRKPDQEHEFTIQHRGRKLRFSALSLHRFIDGAVTAHAEPGSLRLIRDDTGTEIELARREFAKLVTVARRKLHDLAHATELHEHALSRYWRNEEAE